MEIDLYQLPIPDWGLECPKCRYDLRGLPSHRCPECGFKLDMGQIVQTWHRLREPRYTGHELPMPDFGLACRYCRTDLAGATTRECPDCRRRYDPEQFRPRREWFLLDDALCHNIPLAAIETVLATERIPFMRAPDNTLRTIYGVREMIGSRLQAPNEFYFEVLWTIQHIRAQIAEIHERGEDACWHCAACGEDVPEHFEVCWNCGGTRTNSV